MDTPYDIKYSLLKPNFWSNKSLNLDIDPKSLLKGVIKTPLYILEEKNK